MTMFVHTFHAYKIYTNYVQVCKPLLAGIAVGVEVRLVCVPRVPSAAGVQNVV